MLDQINIENIKEIAKLAGDEILKIYSKDFEVYTKKDKSPLTDADKNANDIIVKNLKKLYPDIPIISEEMKLTDYSVRKTWEYCWIIDPLDGTKEFIKKNGEFTVNIALIKNSKPILGVVYIPVNETIYYAVDRKGAFKQHNKEKSYKLEFCNNNHNKKLTVVASRSHISEDVIQFVEKLKKNGKEINFLSAGSSLKFCLIAEGIANVYPRFAPTMEWDTAAAHIICTEAGYKVIDYKTKNELLYNKENLLNPWFIVS